MILSFYTNTIRPVCVRDRPLNSVGRRQRAKNDPKTAVAYLRVSTDRQEHGPEAQRAALESWAAREKIAIVQWFSEEDVSGGDEIEDRPELQAALAALRTRNAGCLVAAKRDRLARDVVIARVIGVQAAANGASVVTADGMSDVEGRPDTFLKQGISDLFAEHERRTIVDRTVQALAVMRRKGYRTGKVPYGFRISRSGPPSKRSGKSLTLELDAREQEICTYIVRRTAEGWSTRQIERDLRAREVTNRAGGYIMQTQIQRIIASCAALQELYPDHANGEKPHGSQKTVGADERREGDRGETHRLVPSGASDGGGARAQQAPARDVSELHRSAERSAETDRVEVPARPTRIAERRDDRTDARGVGNADLKLSCARGHVQTDPKAEGRYCTRGECAEERGTFKPERRIEWRQIT